VITTNHIERIYLGFGLPPKFYEALFDELDSKSFLQGTVVDQSLSRKQSHDGK